MSEQTIEIRPETLRPADRWDQPTKDEEGVDPVNGYDRRASGGPFGPHATGA